MGVGDVGGGGRLGDDRPVPVGDSESEGRLDSGDHQRVVGLDQRKSPELFDQLELSILVGLFRFLNEFFLNERYLKEFLLVDLLDEVLTAGVTAQDTTPRLTIERLYSLPNLIGTAPSALPQALPAP